MTSITIMGSSLSANLTAAYLKKQNPTYEITMIGPEVLSNPIVGESLIEFSTQMFFDIGLDRYLEEEHFHKYSLTFYFKDRLENPADRTYSVLEGLALSPMPSFEINRFTLRKKLMQLNADLGVHFIPQLVKKVETQGYKNHSVIYGDSDTTHTVKSDWVIDTTGRRRLLSRQLGLLRESPVQRCTYWFRLENFDQDFLKKINMVKHFHTNYDYYFCTHHFFGKGNWIWLIPIKSDNGKTLISIGVVWRPDLYPHSIKNIDDFYEHIAKEHPVVTDLTRSGTVLDENFYNHYFYHSSQLYSKDGWFLIGDAGNSVDPLYSPGIACTSLQIHQVEAMIHQGETQMLTEKYVKTLETAYRTTFFTLQDGVARQYEIFESPFQTHFYIHFLVTTYFYFLLPCWLSRYHADFVGAGLMTKLMTQAEPALSSLLNLLSMAADCVGYVPPEKIKNYSPLTVNWKLWGSDERNIPKHLSRMLCIFSYFRFLLLRKARWADWPQHLKIIGLDLLKALILRVFFHKKSLKHSAVIAWLTQNATEFKFPHILKGRAMKEMAMPDKKEMPTPIIE